jgi:hypothetical protein
LAFLNIILIINDKDFVNYFKIIEGNALEIDIRDKNPGIDSFLMSELFNKKKFRRHTLILRSLSIFGAF